jgi:diguanylate cyclase (GGDEF)-like protein
MERLAFYDPLTGLPNRTNGMMLAQQMLDQARQKGVAAAVLFVDLDRFKEINDTHGHIVGDNVLSELAARFRTACARTTSPAWAAMDSCAPTSSHPAKTH